MKRAFTLAEVLMTIGLLGVVAAVALPGLRRDTNGQEIVAKVKAVNLMLNEAYGRAAAKYGPISTWFASDTTDIKRSERFGKRMSEFLKVSKTCGLETKKECFNKNSIKKLSGDDYNTFDNWNDVYKIILTDGTTLGFESYHPNVYPLYIFVDIDGPENGSNTFGIDIFTFQLDSKEGQFIKDKNVLGSQCKNGGNGSFCTDWILLHDNADYLKCDNLTSTNPTCK